MSKRHARRCTHYSWWLAAGLLLWAGSAAAQQQARLAAMDSLPDAAWVSQGDGERIAYVFTDMNCPYCATLYRTLTPMVAERGLQLRWLPVALIGATSEGKAAAVLQADEPLAALDYNKMNFKDGHGGAIEEDIPLPDTEQALRANERLLGQVAVPVVPTLVFQDRSGTPVVVQGAVPGETLARIFERMK